MTRNQFHYSVIIVSIIMVAVIVLMVEFRVTTAIVPCVQPEPLSDQSTGFQLSYPFPMRF